MKLSAKTTITATFFAAMALGMAAFAGCTVSTTTSSDTDGGTSSSSSSSGGSSSSSSSSGSTTTDSGSPTNACPDNTKQTSKFTPDACQACVEAKCCDKLVACFSQDPNAGQDGGTNVDCNVYSDCIADCGQKGGDVQACYANCDAATSQALVTAYDLLDKCATDNCATECQ